MNKHRAGLRGAAAALFTFLTCLLLGAGCGGGDMDADRSRGTAAPEISSGDWNKLVRTPIFFGHQSVGANIIEGLRELSERESLPPLAITELEPGEVPRGGGFLHAAIGSNGDPGSKLSAFCDIIGGDSAAAVDIALFKFCYADITADTDVARLFAQYQQEMARLREAHPSVTFVHVTVPLTRLQRGPKAWLKTILGRPPGGAADNARRNSFNLLMRLTYAETEPLFDLALLESTAPDGSRASFIMDDTQHYALVPAYTDDGGHLNAAGRRMIAAELVNCLTQLKQE